MVELDEGIINWAKDHPTISALNKNIFENTDPRIKIIINDAVSYLRKYSSDVKFDLIYVDFPFPNGHELSKLYSREFYSLLDNASTPDTLVVIDLPIQRETAKGPLTLESRVILKTLKSAGFKNRLPFGPMAAFIAAKKNGAPLAFDYPTIQKNISLATRLNLVRIVDEEELQDIEKETPINSMFWPRGL